MIGRITAWTVLIASIGVAPWFALYASETGRAYRAETPAWTLIPVTLGIGALVVIGLTAGRIAEAAPVSRVVRSERVVRREWTIRLIVGLGGALAWAAAQLYAYSKTARLKGGPILTPQQLDLYADTWIKPYWFAVLPAAIGLALSLVALAAYWRRPQRRPMVDLIIAGICGAPLVIFVVGVGEPPRNYLAQLALAAPLVAIGWIWAVEWFLGERRAWITVPLATAAGLVAGAFIALAPADRRGGARRHRRRPDRVRPRLGADARSARCARRLVVRAARDGRDHPRPVARRRLGRAGPPHPAGATDRQRSGP